MRLVVSLPGVALHVPLALLALASAASATMVVYTDRAAWESAVLAQLGGHFHYQDFQAVLPGGLSSGVSEFHPFYVELPGTSGLNAIDDSIGAPLSPNGSTYYRGEVGVAATVAPVLSFIDYPPMFKVMAFGADWVVSGNLSMEIQGTLIPFGTFLPSGVGFLGIVTDQPENELVANLSGTAQFGMDEIQTGNLVPEPGTGLLLLCGLIGLGAARRGVW